MTRNQSAMEVGNHQKVWMYALAAGCAFIILGNVMGRTVGLDEEKVGWSLAVILALLMILYGYITERKKPSDTTERKISSDTKGEAFYYLGLLFTFMSLVAALINFSTAKEGDDMMGMIGPFGIALFTTIVGLSGRVWFSVWQEASSDPGEEVKYLGEEVKKLTGRLNPLGNAAEGIGHEMEKIKEKFAGAESTVSTVDDHAKKIGSSVGDLTDQVAKLQKAAAKAEGIVSEAASQIESRMVGVAEQADSLSKSMSKMVDATDQGSEAVYSRVEQLLPVLNKAIEQARQVEDVASQAKSVQGEMAKMQAGFSKTAKFFSGAERAGLAIDDHAARIGSSVGGLEGEVAKLLEAAAKAAEAVSGTVPQIEDAGSRMRGVALQADSLRKSMSELVDATDQGREAVSSRVEELEESLAGAGTMAGEMIDHACSRAESVAGDLDGLRDQLTEALKQLSQVVRDGAAAAARAKGRKRKRIRCWPRGSGRQ